MVDCFLRHGLKRRPRHGGIKKPKNSAVLVERPVDRMRILMDASDEVHESLSDMQRMQIIGFFSQEPAKNGSGRPRRRRQRRGSVDRVSTAADTILRYWAGDHTSAPSWRLSRIRGNAASPDGRRVDAGSAACSNGERDDRRERFQAHTAGVGRTSEPATKWFKRIEGSALRPQRNGARGDQGGSGEIQ